MPGKYDESKEKWVIDNILPKSLSELFYKGDPEYVDDYKWFELVSFAITENIFNPFPNSGSLFVNGVNSVIIRVRATVDSIPIRSRVTLVGTNTTLIRVDDAFGLAYTPTNPGDWIAPPPTTVQEALDRIAAKISPV